MCEQTEIDYLDGDIVWVKLGSCWWPGEVVGPERLPPDVLPSFRKPPIAVVKFFQESTYEYVKNINCIYKYNCSKKNEFINKGLYMYRSKHSHMEKFPEDVIRAETAVGGDQEILTREEFQEQKKPSYAGLFGDTPKKIPGSAKKGKGKGRPPLESPKGETPTKKFFKEKSDYQVHILLQGSKETKRHSTDSTPSTSRAGSEPAEEKTKTDEKTTTVTTATTPTTSSGGIYSCHSCNFTTSRLNVLILHNKTHSATYVPYTPSPIKKKLKSPVKSISKSTATKSVKTPRPRKEKTGSTKRASKKRPAESKPLEVEVKKPKTDQEIKSSLLADWDDDAEDDSNDESSAAMMSGSPEMPIGAESPAVPTPAELPSAQVPEELTSSPEKKSDETTDKVECSSDSKYEFCEDEDWAVEADVGRKIPRVKNPSKRKDENKSLSIDEDDVAKEVAELLNKTALPELPSIPDPVKAEENFPDPPVIKSPDKKSEIPLESDTSAKIEVKPTKAIFKTKTFFRSRHSRSQDVIGKYVAEQLNAAERLDMSENDLNSSEAVSSPEARESPPVEHVRVTRMAPKMQLKKMKAEAQLREKEKSIELAKDDTPVKSQKEITQDTSVYKTNVYDSFKSLEPPRDVLYPTQEIKPINKELPEKILSQKDDKISLDTNKDRSTREFEISEIPEMEPLQTNKELKKYKGNSELIHDKALLKITSETQKHSLQNENSSETKFESLPLEEENICNITTSSKSDFNNSNTDKFIDTDANHFTKESKENNLGVPNKMSRDKISFNERKINDHSEPVLLEKQDQKVSSEGLIDAQANYITEESKGNSFDVMDKLFKDKIPSAKEKVEDHSDPVFKENQDQQVAVEELIDSHAHDFTKESKENSFDVMDKLFRDNTTCIGRKIKNHDESVLRSVEDAMPKKSIIQPEISSVTLNITEASPKKCGQTNTKLPKSESLVSKAYNQLIQPYMNESTASAVDALLSVSRETDRVPKIVSNDPPEDLFEDDNKEVVVEDNIAELNVPPDNGHSEAPDEVLIRNHIPEKTNIEKSENPNELQNSVNKHVLEPSSVEYNKQHDQIQESRPSESDLQIAETLLNLPSTAIQNNTSNEQHESNSSLAQHQNENECIMEETELESEIVYNMEQPDISSVSPNNDNLNIRYETEQEKSENLNAAESLVQMSESVDHKINVVEPQESNNKDILSSDPVDTNKNAMDNNNTVEKNIALLSSENKSEKHTIKSPKFETTSSKLLKILEEPSPVKSHVVKSSPLKQVIVTPKEKILNFDIAKSSLKPKPQTPKQKIIIRRGPPNTTIINNLNDVVASPENIILTRNNTSQDGSSIQTFSIQTSTEIQSSNDPKQIIIQPKFRKVTKQPKLQKIKAQNSLIAPMNEKTQMNLNEDQMFDINSMPVVLSEDILTPESIEKMPIVMSDGNLISNSTSNTTNPPKLIKTKPTIIENEKVAISKVHEKVAISPVQEKVAISAVASKPEVKTLLINPSSEIQKTTAPNILSKSSKIRGGKPMLVIDKATGKQKIIMTKPEPAPKEAKPPTTIIQPALQPTPKTEKFIILPTASSPRPGRTQKIVIDPQTGKACVLVAKGQDSPMIAPENKPVSAKIIPSSSDASTPGNTVMIITNAQGAQSRIVLTPEHEKILFPNKQQPNVSQLKTITHRISTNPKIVQKTIVTSASPAKSQTRIVPKQKSTIITSKGQLIVGGRVATTTQNIAPMPEIRPVPKRIIATEPKKLVQTIQKNSSEPLIFLQQKSGAVMQLTAAQFEHLQRTGQIIQKSVAPVQENKVIIQKSLAPKETIITPAKQRVRKIVTESTTPAKKAKQEVSIAPSPIPAPPLAPLPPLTSLSAPAPAPILAISSIIPTVSNTVSVTTSQSFADLENFEELLPSTAIARQPEPPPVIPPPEVQVIAAQPEPPPEPQPAQLADGQLLAVPGENFGGPPGSFYLCVEENGTYTPIDNRPLMLENNQLVPMAVEQVPVFCPQPERRDILEAALANSDVFHAETPHDEAPDFRDLNANVSVHCRVSETSTTLNQPIMTPVEVPSKGESEPAVPSTLEDGLAVIGVTPHTVPTSLELPITVTDPRIAPKTTDPLSGPGYCAGKSMPLLTDEPAASPDPHARLLTPCSDTSEASAEIPFQPALHLSLNDLSRHA